jgi:hypothetical protein
MPWKPDDRRALELARLRARLSAPAWSRALAALRPGQAEASAEDQEPVRKKSAVAAVNHRRRRSPGFRRR